MKEINNPTHTPTNRVRPKRGFRLHVRNVMKFWTQPGGIPVETPNSKVIVCLVVLVFIHIIVIGGIYLRNSLTSPTETVATVTTNLPKTPVKAPVAPAIPVAQPVAVTPVTPVTITQPEQVVNTRQQEQNALQDSDIPDAMPVAGNARHLVRSGDTWESIARDNQITVQDLQMLNPETPTLVSGSMLILPARPGEAVAVTPPVATQPAATGTIHVVKKGETLSAIARKYKTTWRKLQQFNNMSDKDVARIRPGQQIKIPQK